MLATVALLFFSYWPVVQNFRGAPTDRYYYGQSEYPIDMLSNLSLIQQGYQGHLLAWFNLSTMIVGHPSILKIEYTIVGLLGRLLNLSPIVMFMVSRFVISLFVLGVIYVIIRRVFSEPWQRFISYVFVIFGTGMTLPGVSNKLITDGVFQRLTQTMHHYLLGAGTILLALFFLSRALESPKRTGMFLLSLLFGIFASLFNGPNNVLLVSGFPLYIVFDSISVYFRSKRVRIDMVKVGILFAYSAVTLASILYVYYVTTYVWSDIRLAHMDYLNPFRVTPIEYVAIVGVLYILSFIAIPSVIRKGKPFMVLLATWLVMHPVGEFILSPILHFNYLRYFLTPYYFAFGILATSGLTTLSGWIQKYVRAVSRQVILVLLVTAVLASSIGTYISSWQEQHLCFCAGQYFDFGYPKRTVADGIFWLSENTKPDDIVLSGYFAGALIPAFAGNRVYVSWWYRLIEPPTIGNTEANLAAFYGGTMSDSDAYAFLKRENISYVFYSEQEQTFAAGKADLQYPFLTDRYNKAGTVIYQVK
jgi:hypothetical protein